MAVINTTVFCDQSKRTVLPWTILQLKEESHTFDDFFLEIVKPRLETPHCKLLSTYIGSQKSSLDPVDTDLIVLPVVSSFGRFLKYHVECCEDSLRVELEVPGPSVNVRNKKDLLYNDLISLFLSLNSVFAEEEIKVEGKMLLTTLRDILRYIDGYHSIFAERAIAVPKLFQQFIKYNVPEVSKHRKRRTGNISSDQLNGFVQDLCTILHHDYWDRPNWKEIKPSITELCESLAAYVEYLSMKNKRAKANHRSPTPVRDLGENMKLKFLPLSDGVVEPILKPIDDLLVEKPVYTHFSLADLVPADPVKRHRFILTLESTGLSFSSILLIYLPGGNVCNLHFLWKVPEHGEIGDYIEQSQPVIEAIKQDIPVYHTRAMKASVFKKFGRVSPQVKPSVLRYFYRELTGKID